MRKPLVIIAVVLISLVIGILIWNNPGILHLKYTRSVQEDPVLKKVTESISNGKEYLLRTIDPELGGVHKYYYPKTGEFDRELTTTYTATTLYALQKISNNVRADPRIAEVTPKVVDFLFSMQNNDPDDRGYGGFQYSYDLVTGKKDSMYVSGTNSKTIFLMLYMYDLTGENKYLESAVKAGDFLLTLQMNNGTIVSYIKKDGEGHWYRSTEYSYLYNSESLSALSRLYARTGEQRFLDEADMIATKFALDINDSGCYVGDDYRVPNPISSAWLIMSMFDYFQVALDPDIKELVEECSLEMLDRQLTNESQKDYGRWREAYSTSANGWIMEVMSELHTYCVLNAEENCEKYMSAIRKANAWMEQRTYNGSNYYSDPGAVGGIIRYDDDWSIRTDSVAHTMTAYANAYGYLKENSKEDIGKNEIILYAVGDLVLDRGIERKVYEKGGGDYSFPFIPIRKKLDEADILFGNLESQMSDLSGIKADKLADNPVYFKAEEKAVSGLKYAGFDILSVANNHALDYGREVFLDSLRILDHAGIAYVGGGKDIQDSQLKVIESKGTRIGFIGYTYPRSDRVYASWEPGVVQSGVNVAEFDELEALSEAAADAKKKVDILIVSLHGGTQYTPEPDEYQRVVSEALIKGGADLIIGHHPLVVQPLVRYKSGWIAYSLGNFVFDRRDREHSSGVILEVTIAENRIRSLGYTGVQLTEDFQPALAGTAEETGAKPSFGFRWAPEALAAVIILLTLALYRETDFTEKPKKKGHFMIKAYRHAIRFISRYYFLLYIIAFLLLVRNDFSVLSLNHQEIDYLTISSKSAKDIIFNTYGDQLPVWFLLLKAYTAVFGFSQPILVAFSVFFFILAAWSFTWLAGIYRLNKALVAGLILFNPLLIMGVATLVKHWSFLMLLVGLTLFFYEKAKLQNRVRDYMYLGLTAAIGLYSNLIYIVFCFLLSIYV
ncbi:MAG: CapA family protein, partial [Nanoarchaeota archaeon]|nr:CapA family protein [Nanoarchaeota archaeon]